MNITEFNQLESIDVSKLTYINKESVPIITVVSLDSFTIGRLDLLIDQYYDGDIQYYIPLLEWNKITNPFNLKIGDIIEIPDFPYFISTFQENELFGTDRIPGINPSVISADINSKYIDKKNSPKNNIKMKPVKYDRENGYLIY